MADPALAAPQSAPAEKLDDLMLAMDVVDTLRHQEGLALKELAQDGRDATLKARLRQIYEAQGLAVDDRILDEGIRALKEARFTYVPAPAGFGRTLAILWVKRRTAGIAAALVVALILATGGWLAGRAERSGGPRRRHRSRSPRPCRSSSPPRLRPSRPRRRTRRRRHRPPPSAPTAAPRSPRATPPAPGPPSPVFWISGRSWFGPISW